MNIEEEQKYEDTIEEIIFQLETLMVEMMLNSIRRVKSTYDQMLTQPEKQDDFQF